MTGDSDPSDEEDESEDDRPPLPASVIAKGEILQRLFASDDAARPPSWKLIEAHPVVLDVIREVDSDRERFFDLAESLDWDLLGAL